MRYKALDRWRRSDGYFDKSPFKTEREMQHFYANNLHLIEPGLRPIESDPSTAIEFKCGERRADLIVIDESGTLVVIELKREIGSYHALGQLLTYMAWARRAFPHKVRGIIVARLADPEVCLAAEDIGNVAVLEYLPDKRLERVTIN